MNLTMTSAVGSRRTLNPSHPDLAALRGRQAQISALLPGRRVEIGPCVTTPQLFMTGEGQIWLTSGLAQDPLTNRDGGYVLPRAVAAELRQIKDAGMEFHGMAIAHQIARDERSDRLVPLLRDGARPCTDEVARALVGPVPAYHRATRAAGVAQRIVEAVATAAHQVTRVLPSAADLLDPVIFGLVSVDGRLEHGQPVIWVPCAEWVW